MTSSFSHLVTSNIKKLYLHYISTDNRDTPMDYLSPRSLFKCIKTFWLEESGTITCAHETHQLCVQQNCISGTRLRHVRKNVYAQVRKKLGCLYHDACLWCMWTDLPKTTERLLSTQMRTKDTSNQYWTLDHHCN